MKVTVSASQPWKVVAPIKVPQRATNAALMQGTATMSQRDVMQSAMDGAYHNTSMYGAPKGSI